MPDNYLVAAPFADRHVATASASITVTIAPIVIAIIIATLAVASVSVTAIRSNAEVQLSKRNSGFGRDSIPSISGVCRESPHYARDGSDKRKFPIRIPPLPTTLRRVVNRKAMCSFVL
jgi:hypothetical protein